MVTLPKRKLKLWYSKNDYKKERENETKRLSEQLQNDELAKTTTNDEMTESLKENNESQSVDLDSRVPTPSEINQLTETENQSAVSVEDSISQNLPSAALSENQGQLENDKKSEPQPVNDSVSTQIVTQQNIADSENKTESASAVSLPSESAQETTETPKENEKNQIASETETLAIVTQNQSQTENESIPIVTTASVELSKETTLTEPKNDVTLIENVENIEKNIEPLKHDLPTRALVCIGEYPINIILKGSFSERKDEDILPIFVEKSFKEVAKWSKGRLDQNNIVSLEEEIDTHFWYNILPYVVENENFFAHIKSMPTAKLRSAILVSATWSGIGSSLFPILNSQFKEWNISTAGLAILPSKAQPLDGQFNSFASIGIYSSKEAATLILIDRDNLEDYSGVDRNGYTINGNTAANYLLDLMLSKETFVQELGELSASFDSKIFTVLLASGESLKIYGSIENILNTTLLKPLFTFDLATATLLYALVRMPLHLKDKLPRGKIELAIANWFKDKANLESIYLSDPIYVEDSSDRIDIGMFLGGFETATRFSALNNKITKVKNQAIKKGSITEQDWQSIVKSLVE